MNKRRAKLYTHNMVNKSTYVNKEMETIELRHTKLDTQNYLDIQLLPP